MKQRIQIAIRGKVQGVGFRPFVYRLANRLSLKGYVSNSLSGALIEVEGNENETNEFISKLKSEKPVNAEIISCELSNQKLKGFNKFEIKESDNAGNPSAIILPDIALCDDCLNEMLNINNRRYQYPFTNCTNCGPRLTIIEKLPYDRQNTSMKNFVMCEKCRDEYENPDDRRFHAQPISCWHCGPTLSLCDSAGKLILNSSEVIEQTADLIHQGFIVAVKGLGGFHLMADAKNDDAIAKLRRRKNREEKPFACMSSRIELIKEICFVSREEEQLLTSSESPIVLLKKNKNSFSVSNLVAPGNPYLGIMLPYTPLHYLLMKAVGMPVVATSGNLSDEPICYDENEALKRLGGIADYFLVHNRPIVRPVDDSIVRVIDNKTMMIRRARGYAPLPVSYLNDGIKNAVNENKIIALGGQLKSTISICHDDKIITSQHLGDLSTVEANQNFEKVYCDYTKLYKAEDPIILCDLHPDYYSTQFAKSKTKNPVPVQHHIAHILSCRLENKIAGEALGIAWDGTGYGLDGSIWGGEFFLVDESEIKHIAQFKKFKLPGGEIAIKDIRRSALGLLYEGFGKETKNVFSKICYDEKSSEITTLINMIDKNINCYSTSSPGRIFDGVSLMLGLAGKSSFEGQAAMALEFAVDENESGSYSIEFLLEDKIIIDWRPMIIEIVEDINKNIAASGIAAKFHNTLAEIIFKVAEQVGEKNLILSGGCFQNKYLMDRIIRTGKEKKLNVYRHHEIPTNDGGVSAGQIMYYLKYHRK
ncbi:MAG: carbamoyltransferase HypF [Ignavibacteriales bacterium]|nr:MAG: carbamoyltransferase HypF [Ignavibacteriales bacterium]